MQIDAVNPVFSLYRNMGLARISPRLPWMRRPSVNAEKSLKRSLATRPVNSPSVQSICHILFGILQ